MSRRDIEFDAEGVTLRGWFYRAEGADGQAPAVVMAHGFSAVKEMHLDSFAEVFAAAGGPVLSGQYRLMIRAERDKAVARGSNDDTEIVPYTDDELAAAVTTVHAAGATAVAVSWDGAARAVLEVTSPLRTCASEAADALRELGFADLEVVRPEG